MGSEILVLNSEKFGVRWLHAGRLRDLAQRATGAGRHRKGAAKGVAGGQVEVVASLFLHIDKAV